MFHRNTIMHIKFYQKGSCSAWPNNNLANLGHFVGGWGGGREGGGGD